MRTCQQIELFVQSPSQTLSESQAREWLNHVADCGQCADRLIEAPTTAAMLLEHSHGSGQDPRDELARPHEEVLELGKVLAKRIDGSVCAQLDVPEGIEPLRHEFRHAPNLANATVSDIRCAIAIAELSHALEGLVFQDEEGSLRRVSLSLRTGESGIKTRHADDLSIQVGDESVPLGYFVERIAEAIACKAADMNTACRLLHGIADLLADNVLSIPEFVSIVDAAPNGVRIQLIHDSNTDDIAFAPEPDGWPEIPTATPSTPRTPSKPMPSISITHEPD